MTRDAHKPHLQVSPHTYRCLHSPQSPPGSLLALPAERDEQQCGEHRWCCTHRGGKITQLKQTIIQNRKHDLLITSILATLSGHLDGFFPPLQAGSISLGIYQALTTKWLLPTKWSHISENIVPIALLVMRYWDLKLKNKINCIVTFQWTQTLQLQAFSQVAVANSICQMT